MLEFLCGALTAAVLAIPEVRTWVLAQLPWDVSVTPKRPAAEASVKTGG